MLFRMTVSLCTLSKPPPNVTRKRIPPAATFLGYSGFFEEIRQPRRAFVNALRSDRPTRANRVLDASVSSDRRSPLRRACHQHGLDRVAVLQIRDSFVDLVEAGGFNRSAFGRDRATMRPVPCCPRTGPQALPSAVAGRGSDAV